MPKLSNNADYKKYAELVFSTFYIFSIQTGQVFALIINFKSGKCILIINIPMNSNIFEQEFNRRYKGTNLKLSRVGRGKEYVISNEEVSKVLLVRTEFSCLDEKMLMHERRPAPFLNAEAVVFFKFRIDDLVYPPEFIVFIYDYHVLGRTDFLIFRYEELKARLRAIQLRPDKGGYYNLLLWIFINGFVFVATNLSGEGEWYMLGGLQGGGDCMARGGERDFSTYLNNWRSIL
jgi:hypothetical protein